VKKHIKDLAKSGGLYSLPLILALALLASKSLAATASDDSPQWILVTTPAFVPALNPLIEHRRQEGFKVTIVKTTDVFDAEQSNGSDHTPLQARVARLCNSNSGPNFILLAGAAMRPDGISVDGVVVPPARGKVSRMKSHASDFGYASADEKGLPKAAVGRFPARSVQEMEAMVRKTLAFETDGKPGAWRNRIAAVGGNPGGGPMVEMMIEQVLGPRLARIDPAYNIEMVYHSSSSPYFLPTSSSLLHDEAIRSIEAGELMSLYFGHSRAPAMFSVDTNFMTLDDWANLKIPRGQGIFFTTGCFACQLEGPEGEGFGLAAIRNPAGPVAVIGASAESYAAAGQLALDGLLTKLSPPSARADKTTPSSASAAPKPQRAVAPLPRLGDYWLAVQSGLASGKMDQFTFGMYDQFDGSQGKIPLAVQRLEHLEMWMLLGDPALRLPLLQPELALELDGAACAGKPINVSSTLPARLAGANIRVTLERPISSSPRDREKLPASSPENRAEYERIAIANHRRTNNFVITSVEARAQDARFTCSVDVPSGFSWTNAVIRAYATKGDESALGVIKLPVAH
jgi:hypothetical protein